MRRPTTVVRTVTAPLVLIPAVLLIPILAAVLGPVPASAQEGRGQRDTLSTVSGSVSDHETARPVLGATVSLTSGSGETLAVRTGETGRDGRFAFTGLPAGDYRLTVDRLGYHILNDSITVPPGAELRVQAELSTLPLDLEPIVVVVGARDVVPGLGGRAHRGVGTIITRDRIEATKAQHVSEILRLAPGVRLVPEGDLGYTVRLRGGCRPAIWIDDARTQSIDVDAILLPSDIEAVEVYHANELPARFGQDPCGAVVFWTRTKQPGTGKMSAWKRVALSAAVLAGMLLVRLH